ncbi:MAG: peptidase and in, kexin, sedolisin [Gammaproteobacteria bacterium]|nr:peptidase and in, kexin, sedolisin [Gammaproteobacteria bacterium]
MRTAQLVSSISIALFSMGAAAAAAPAAQPASINIVDAVATAPSLYIVQAGTMNAARRSVNRVDAKVEKDLAIIHSVSAYLTPEQANQLRKTSGVRLFEDRPLATRGLVSLLTPITTAVVAPVSTLTTPVVSIVGTVAAPILAPLAPVTTPVIATVGGVAAPLLPVATPLAAPLVNPLVSPAISALSANTTLKDGTGVSSATLLYGTNYPTLVGADTLQQSGITGKGVTIAVLDSGLWQDPNQNFGGRVLASIDVLNGGTGRVQGDSYGHGTHVTSIAAGGAQNLSLGYLGIAPQANLVIVRAFDGTGAGRYADVIAGLNWIVTNKKKYNIRVLNLSFGAQPQSYYWDDPLNQAVMAAWRAGIVVVAAAGNEGPDPMTIDVPGNVPYVITVGALTDNYTPYDGTDDRLASFSSTGPTFEGFVKPELVSPGGHMAASMQSNSYLANIDPHSMSPGEQMFTMSGTSQAAAVTSGVVALMLQSDPTLTPDTVKCRLLTSARPAVTSAKALAYSVFQQGAGLINAVSAVNNSALDCANQGLDINADLAGTAHFGGPANQDANGNYYIMNLGASTWAAPLAGDGYTWSRGYTWSKGYTWSEGYTWSKGYTWSRGYTWSKGYTWSRGYTWSKGYTWSRTVPWWSTSPAGAPATTPASIVPWVPNE